MRSLTTLLGKSARRGRNYFQVTWQNSNQNWNYQFIYSFTRFGSFWEFRPLLASHLVGICIIPTGLFIAQPSHHKWVEQFNIISISQWPQKLQKKPAERRRWAWTWREKKTKKTPLALGCCPKTSTWRTPWKRRGDLGRPTCCSSRVLEWSGDMGW